MSIRVKIESTWIHWSLYQVKEGIRSELPFEFESYDEARTFGNQLEKELNDTKGMKN